jgi:hypothetical protein
MITIITPRTVRGHHHDVAVALRLPLCGPEIIFRYTAQDSRDA